MRIALDAMGGDNAPVETVAGAIEAAREYGLEVVLVGKPDAIRTELANGDWFAVEYPQISLRCLHLFVQQHLRREDHVIGIERLAIGEPQSAPQFQDEVQPVG